MQISTTDSIDQYDNMEVWDAMAGEALYKEKPKPDYSYYPPNAFSPWCDKWTLERLLPAMKWMHDYYFYQVLRNCPLGYCDIGILAVKKGGIVLGFQFGTPDEMTTTIHWITRFVPRSLIEQDGLTPCQLGTAIYDLPMETVAKVVGHEIADPDEPDEDNQDDAVGNGNEYLYGQCGMFESMIKNCPSPPK